MSRKPIIAGNWKMHNNCAQTIELIEGLKQELKDIDKNVNIVIGCQNMCGIGLTKNFAIVDHIPIIANNEDELIEKIKQLKK